MKNPQFSFTAGELSPSLHSRVDLARYATALKTCKNFIVRQQGGVDNRPGTRLIGEQLDSGSTSRFIPFTYSSTNGYVIVFNGGKIRFVSNGALITRVATVAWDSGTNYALGDIVLKDGVTWISLQAGNLAHDPGDVWIHGIRSASPTWWSPNPPYEISHPYTDVEIAELHYTQSVDVMTLTTTSQPIYDLRRYGDTDWRLALFDAVDGPFRDPNFDESSKMAATAASGTVTITATKPVFDILMEGSLVYLEEQELRNTKPWEPGERNVAVGVYRRSDFKTYKCVSVPSASGLAGTPYYLTGAVRPVHESGRAFDGPQDSRTDGTNGYKVGVEWEYVHGGFGIVKINTYVSPYSVTGSVLRRLPDSCVGGVGSPTTICTAAPSIRSTRP